MLDIEDLKRWFELNKRDLPWRESHTPYRVWVSEIMLQQTQVSTVIPYFHRWMIRFPDVKSLAAAPLDDVLKMWEGLGYYSRARSLHEGAKYLLTHHNGCMPDDKEQLSKIKGIGPYTVGAIMSFAFHKKAAAVDGNVIRVLARYFHLEDDISKPLAINKIRQLAESFMPDDEHWIVNEALIELGATICQKKAKCSLCPLKPNCQGYAKGVVEKLPYKSKKTTITPLFRSVAVIQCADSYLVKRGDAGKIMSDLYEFPYIDITEKGIMADLARKQFSEELGLTLFLEGVLSQEMHSFTRYRVRLDPILYSCNDMIEVKGYEWKNEEELKKLAFSSGHKRILDSLV